MVGLLWIIFPIIMLPQCLIENFDWEILMSRYVPDFVKRCCRRRGRGYVLCLWKWKGLQYLMCFKIIPCIEKTFLKGNKGIHWDYSLELSFMGIRNCANQSCYCCVSAGLLPNSAYFLFLVLFLHAYFTILQLLM